jgi:hypothetical protein
MTKKGKNKNLNMFVRNNGKEEHVPYPLLYVAKIVLETRVCRTCIFANNKKFIVLETTLGP